VDTNKQLEESIRKEIRDWSKHSLEKQMKTTTDFLLVPMQQRLG